MPYFQCMVPIDFSKGCFTYDLSNGFWEHSTSHIQESIDENPTSMRIYICHQQLAGVLHGVYPSDEAVLAWNCISTEFSQLRVLALDGKNLTDKCIDGFVNFENLKILDLGETQITEVGWAKLRKMLPECEMQPKEKTFSINVLEALYYDYCAELNLEDTKTIENAWITDEDVAALADLPLEGLILYRCKITDKAMDSIVKMKSLKYLSLRATGITDAAMEKLLELPKLEILDVAETDITDAGLAMLAKSPTLRKLSVGHTKISTKGLQAFPETCKIEQLILIGTNINNNTLKILGKWQHLKYLDLSFTRVTRAGFAHVEKPGLFVQYDSPR